MREPEPLAAPPLPPFPDPVAAGLTPQQLGIERLHTELEAIYLQGGVSAIDVQHKRGALTARERVARLIDDADEFLEWGEHAGMGLHEDAGGANAARVITGVGRIGGKAHVVIANDPTIKGGTFVGATCRKVIDAQKKALKLGLPVVYLVGSGGIFLPGQDETYAGKDGFGSIFEMAEILNANGIPQRTVVTDGAAAGGAYKLPIAWSGIAMVQRPNVIVGVGAAHLTEAGTGEIVNDETFGMGAHHFASGLVDFIAPTDEEVLDWTRRQIIEDNRLSDHGPLYPTAAPQGCPPLKVEEVIARKISQERPATEIAGALEAVKKLRKKKKGAEVTSDEINQIFGTILPSVHMSITRRVVEVSVAAMFALSGEPQMSFTQLKELQQQLKTESDTDMPVALATLSKVVTDTLVNENASLVRSLAGAIAQSETKESRAAIAAALAQGLPKVESDLSSVVDAALQRAVTLRQTELEERLRNQWAQHVALAVHRIITTIITQQFDSLEQMLQAVSEAVLNYGQAVFQEVMNHALLEAIGVDVSSLQMLNGPVTVEQSSIAVETEHIRSKMEAVLREQQILAATLEDQCRIARELEGEFGNADLDALIVEHRTARDTALAAAQEDAVAVEDAMIARLLRKKDEIGKLIGQSVREAAEQRKREVILRLERSRANAYKDAKEEVEVRPDDLFDILPNDPRGQFDVRNVIECMIDPGTLQEVDPQEGPGLVCGFATIGGRKCAIIANQGMNIEQKCGKNDDMIHSARLMYNSEPEKGARFIALCKEQNCPIVSYHNVSGFQVGTHAESIAELQAGEKMLYEMLGDAKVPVISVTYKTFGAGNYVMHHNADFRFAWADSEYCVMSGNAAGTVMGLLGYTDLQQLLPPLYKEQATPQFNAARGHIDKIIDPRLTHYYLAAVLKMMEDWKYEPARNKRFSGPAERRGGKPFSGAVYDRMVSYLSEVAGDNIDYVGFRGVSNHIPVDELTPTIMIERVADRVSELAREMTLRAYNRWQRNKNEKSTAFPSASSRIAKRHWCKIGPDDALPAGFERVQRRNSAFAMREEELSMCKEVQAPYLRGLVQIFHPKIAQHLDLFIDEKQFERLRTNPESYRSIIQSFAALVPLFQRATEDINDTISSDLFAPILTTFMTNLATAQDLLGGTN